MRNTSVDIKLHLASTENYESVEGYLMNKKVNFYACKRPLKITLGLHNMDCNVLQKQVESNQAVGCMNIKKIKPPNPGFKDKTIYILHCAKGTIKLSELRKVKSVCHTIV